MSPAAPDSHGSVPSSAAGPARLCIMLSGAGRTMLNLHRAIGSGQLPAVIAKVIASGMCPGVEHARSLGIETAILPGTLTADVLAEQLRSASIDFVVLAGYLKKVPVIPGYETRIVNIHPALLPEFGGKGMYGLRVHEAVIAAGRLISGCTIHLCDGDFDTGEILLQRECPVLPADSAAGLAARVFEQECVAYPQALAKLIAQQGALRSPFT